MALEIKVLGPQVFIDFREKIQKSRLKESTWIFEEHVFSFLSYLCISASGWYDWSVFSVWAYWNKCDNVEWQMDAIKLLIICLNNNNLLFITCLLLYKGFFLMLFLIFRTSL